MIAGVIGVKSLIIGGQKTLSEIDRQVINQEYNNVSRVRPPKPFGAEFGMRSVGANGFPRARVTEFTKEKVGILSDVDVNS
jgi:hypothetical protein